MGNAIYPLQELSGMIEGLNLVVKRDGSLQEGFELISQPFSLTWLAENMGNLAALLRKMASVGFNSYDTGTCGMHIHVNRNSFISPLHQWRFWLFFMENYKFFHVLSKRDHASSAKYAGYYATPRKNLGIRIQNVPREAHHEAIEMQHKNSIEVRIFRGTLNYKTIVNEILLVNAIREYTGCSSVASQSIDEFLNWLQTTYTSVEPDEVGGKQYVVLFNQNENIATIKATQNKIAKENEKKLLTVVRYGSPAVAIPVKPKDHIEIPNSRWSNAPANTKPVLVSMRALPDAGIYKTETGACVGIWNPEHMLIAPPYWVNNLLHSWITQQVVMIELYRHNAAPWYMGSLASAIPVKTALKEQIGSAVIDFLSRKTLLQMTVHLFRNGFYLDYNDLGMAHFLAAYKAELGTSRHLGFRINAICDAKGNVIASHDKDRVLGPEYQPTWRQDSTGNWIQPKGFFQEEYGIRIETGNYKIQYAKYLSHETEPRIAITDREPIKKKEPIQEKQLNDTTVQLNEDPVARTIREYNAFRAGEMLWTVQYNHDYMR